MNENLGKSNMNEEQLTKLNTTKRVQNKRWEKKWQLALLALEQFMGQTCGSCEFCFLSILMPAGKKKFMLL